MLPTGARSSYRARAYLAGSGVFTDACIGHILATTDVSLADAIDMAGARPRQLLGLAPRPLQVGPPADLILFDWQPGEDFRLRAVVLGGQASDFGSVTGGSQRGNG